MKPKLIEMDTIIESIWKSLNVEKYFSNSLMIVLGDHGMNSVKKKRKKKQTRKNLSYCNLKRKTKNFYPGTRFYWYSLEGSNDNGEFSRKVIINGSGPSLDAGGPADYHTLKARSAPAAGGIKVTVPGRGIIVMAIDKK